MLCRHWFIFIPTAALPIHHPAKAPREAVEDGPSLWTFATSMRYPEETLHMGVVQC